MINNLIHEIMKLKRDRLFIILLSVTVLSPLLLVISMDQGSTASMTWEYYLLKGQVPVFYCTFIFLIVTGCSVFAKEYQLKTVQVIYITSKTRGNIFLAKMTMLFAALSAATIAMGFINILFGTIITGQMIPGNLLLKYSGVLLLSVPVYFAVVSPAVLLSLLLKRAAAASIIYFGLAIFLFPFRQHAEVIPPLIPVNIMIHLLKPEGFLSASQYYTPSLDMSVSTVSLIIYFTVPAVISFFYMKYESVST